MKLLSFFLVFFILYSSHVNSKSSIIDSNKHLLTILSHPSVIEKKLVNLSNLALIDEAKSQLLPSVNFSTSGGYSVFGNYSNSNTRTRYASGDYIDGKINTRQLLYDSDTTVLNIRSQISKTSSTQFDIKIAENEIIYKFLLFCLETLKYHKYKDLYNKTISNLNRLSELAEKKFIAGLTDEKEFREIKMLLTELEVNQEAFDRLTQTAVKTLSSEFGEDTELSMSTFTRLIEFSKTEDIQKLISSSQNKQFSIKQLQFQSKSLNDAILANENDKMPKVFLNLDTTFFNINELDTEYEISANLSVDLPFFDAGANASRGSSLQLQNESILSRIDLETKNASRRLLSINENQQNNIEQIETIERQAHEVRDYLSQLNTKLGSVEVSLREIASSYKKLYDLQEIKFSKAYEQDLLHLETIALKESWGELANLLINQSIKQ